MKKSLLIIVAAIIILLIGGVWGYLMLYGAPDSLSPQGNTSDTLPTNSPTGSVTIIDEDSGVIDVMSDGLQQLSTKAVAGNTIIDTRVRFAQQGTGHIYDIDLESGRETQISRTTIPEVSDATFSSSGERVALTAYNNYQSATVVGTIATDGTLTTITLEPNAQNISFISDDVIAYTVLTAGETVGYHQNLSSQIRTEVFRIAFANIAVAWGSDADSTVIYPKPTTELPSATYLIAGNGRLTPLSEEGYATVITPVGPQLILTAATTPTGNLVSSVLGRDNEVAPMSMVPEKCTQHSANQIWCAVPFTDLTASELLAWYKGAYQSNDVLWEIDPFNGGASPLASPSEEVGRPLDMTQLTANADGSLISFINKTDRSLWLYRQN